jgi:glycine/D-amino acid oxidase-like deaminating enzyme
MKLKPYWIDTAPAFTQGASEPVEGRVDVAVVGAGFTGLSVALALSKRGARVMVLEAGHVMNAASGRNGGMCNNGFAQNHAAMAQKLGQRVYRSLQRRYREFGRLSGNPPP